MNMCGQLYLLLMIFRKRQQKKKECLLLCVCAHTCVCVCVQDRKYVCPVHTDLFVWECINIYVGWKGGRICKTV